MKEEGDEVESCLQMEADWRRCINGLKLHFAIFIFLVFFVCRLVDELFEIELVEAGLLILILRERERGLQNPSKTHCPSN